MPACPCAPCIFEDVALKDDVKCLVCKTPVHALCARKSCEEVAYVKLFPNPLFIFCSKHYPASDGFLNNGPYKLKVGEAISGAPQREKEEEDSEDEAVSAICGKRRRTEMSQEERLRVKKEINTLIRTVGPGNENHVAGNGKSAGDGEEEKKSADQCDKDADPGNKSKKKCYFFLHYAIRD